MVMGGAASQPTNAGGWEAGRNGGHFIVKSRDRKGKHHKKEKSH